MKRYFYFNIFFFIFCFFLSITGVSAKECTTEEFRELKSLAKKVEVSYELGESAVVDEYKFLVKAYNLNNKFYLETKKNIINPIKSTEAIGYYMDGQKVSIKIYASANSNCVDEYLNTIYLELPRYNKYSSNKKCLEHQKLNVCKKWYDTSNLTEKEFLSIIEKKTPQETKKSFIDIIAELIAKYWFVLFIILLIIVLFILINRRIKENKKQKIEI